MQLLRLLAYRAVNPPSSSSPAEETTPPLAPPRPAARDSRRSQAGGNAASGCRHDSRMSAAALPNDGMIAPTQPMAVSSIVIANDPNPSQGQVTSLLVIRNDPIEGRQRRQIFSAGGLPPLTGGSLCCQIRRQLDAGGSGTSATPCCAFHQVAASSASSFFTASKSFGANSLGVSSG
jgi:hypothetical protein